MKAKQRILGWLLLVTILLGGVLALLVNHNQKEKAASSAATEGTIPLLSFGAGALSQIVVETGGETLTLMYADTGWTLAEDPAYHLDETACNAMQTDLMDLNAKRQLTAEAEEDYGFDVPQATVTVTADGQTTVFHFGAENPATGDVYLQKEGDDAVYTVAASKLAPFQTSKANLFGAFNPAGLTRSSIEAVTYTRADGETVRLNAVSEQTASEETAAESSAASDGTTYQTTWRLTEDASATLDETKLDALLNALSGYATAQITDADPSVYGFDTPLVTADVTTADGTVTLTYATGTDGYYLMVNGDPSIYTVDSSTVEALCLSAEQLLATKNEDPAQ